MIAVATPICACCIRLANLMNSEIIGKATDVPWAFVFERVDMTPRHPAQLYEAIAYFVFFLIMYLFRDTTLTDEVRINNLLSLLTLDEKISLLSTDLGIPRFGIPHCGHFEGLHGLALGGPAMWGGRKKNEDGRVIPTNHPTTIFPQAYGLGSTWDIDLVKRVSQETAEEARYYTQSSVNKQHAFFIGSIACKAIFNCTTSRGDTRPTATFDIIRSKSPIRCNCSSIKSLKSG